MRQICINSYLRDIRTYQQEKKNILKSCRIELPGMVLPYSRHHLHWNARGMEVLSLHRITESSRTSNCGKHFFFLQSLASAQRRDYGLKLDVA